MVVTMRAIPASATSKPYFLCLWVVGVWGRNGPSADCVLSRPGCSMVVALLEVWL